MFDETVRSQHEPDATTVIAKIIEHDCGQLTTAELADFVRKRDRRLYLDVDSSQMNVYLLAILVKEFEDAKFLLTIRDCYSWLNSFINYCLISDMSEIWLKYRTLRFGSRECVFSPQERILQERGLYPLKGYLSYWTYHNQRVLDLVPHARLIVVKTRDITSHAYRIAEFAGLPARSVWIEASHASRTSRDYGMINQLDAEYLDSQMKLYCADLMRQFYPKITSIRDLDVSNEP